MLLALVAVPVPLGRAFSYTLPADLVGRVGPGSRVVCEFGRRRVLGVVLQVEDREPEIAPEKLKPIRALVDSEPVIPGELLSFLEELSSYYFAPVGEVMRLALPAVERADAALVNEELKAVKGARTLGRLLQSVSATERDPPAALKGQAREIWQELKQRGPQSAVELGKRWKSARAALKRLAELELVELKLVSSESDPFFGSPVARDEPPALNAAQAAAVATIQEALTGQESRRFLLQGVTASGKTEVYLRAVERCLELAGGAIVLVPEIALTPQLVARFRARLGDSIAVVHSALSNSARHSMWKKLRSGQLRVAVGARSALFAPLPDLRLICVDEEHDGSFKQEEGVRYHARDMALLRAHRAGAVCVLGSATPSLSSVALVGSGKLEHLRLPQRARDQAELPKVEIVDLRRMGAGPSGERLLSLPLHRALERVLKAREQAILFLNRRGFAPSLVCEGCGTISECPNCSVALTLHRGRGGRLVCHYCEYTVQLPPRCPRCASDRLELEGAGTERIEHALRESFPEARVARLDRDVAGGAKSERILDRVRRGEVDILVGTQMVTKGHDLPAVTLVGVLNADAALSMPDFRAAERTFQLLVQVAGRAGRADKSGTVMIQTRDPDHPAVRFAARHDVDGFIERELLDRKELVYPPFSRMVMVRVDAVEETRARDEAGRLASAARRAAGSGLSVLGPAAAPLARLRNRYRFRFMLRSSKLSELRRAVRQVLALEPDRRVRVTLDVDPVSML